MSLTDGDDDALWHVDPLRSRGGTVKPGLLLGTAALAAVTATRWRTLSRVLRVAAIALIAVLALVASGLLTLPSVDTMAREASRTLGAWTYPVVGGFAFAESGAGVGLVAPGELMVLFGGVSAAHHGVALVPLIAVVWSCALGGDLVAFTLGRRFGRDALLRHGAGLGITAERLDRVERFLAEHGTPTILVGRFIGVVRALAPFVAGASGMPARRFVPVAVVASGLWAATFCTLGWAFGDSFDTLVPAVERASLGLGALAVAVLCAMALRRRLSIRSRAGLGPRVSGGISLHPDGGPTP